MLFSTVPLSIMVPTERKGIGLFCTVDAITSTEHSMFQFMLAKRDIYIWQFSQKNFRQSFVQHSVLILNYVIWCNCMVFVNQENGVLMKTLCNYLDLCLCFWNIQCTRLRFFSHFLLVSALHYYFVVCQLYSCPTHILGIKHFNLNGYG